MDDGAVLAVVTFAAPHGTERRTLGPASPELRFGRHGDCPVRVGHAPLLDEGIPRVAGRVLLVGGERVAVENLDEVYAFDVAAKDGPRTSVRPGELFSPQGHAFELVLMGRAAHTVRVAVAPRMVRPIIVSAGSDPGPVTTAPPKLTQDERAVLDAYLSPLRAGKAVRATHVEAAETLGRSKTWVRNKAADIYDKFFLAPVPMRDFADQVDAVTDAAWRHGL